MSKKKPNKILDDFDLDSGLDDFKFDEFNFDDNVKDDRKAISKVISGIKSGAKETAKSPRFYKDVLKASLPTGYGQTIDFSDKTLESLKGLYDESAKELKPAWKATKQTVTRMVPSDSKILPKSIQKLLERWKKEERESARPGQADREVLLASTMQEIFQTQAVEGQKEKAEAQTHEKLKEGVEEIRFNSMFAAANATAMATSRMDAYNSGINFKYQKKSLELQYRQLFAIQDLHKFNAEDAIRRNEYLAVIAKNTSLPDAVKIQDAEAKALIKKTKLYESIFGGMYGKRNRYIENAVAGAKSKVLNSVKELTSGLYSGMSMLEMAGTASDLGVDPHEMGGMVVGSSGLEALGKYAGRKLKNKLIGSNFDKRFGISDRGKKLEGYLANLPNKLNEFKRNGEYAWSGGLKGTLMMFLQDMLPGMGVDNKTRRYTSKDMGMPVAFTRRTDRSINEVIPGYLARILQEIQITRSGNANTPLLKFDHDSGNFVSAKTLRNRIKAGVVNESRQAILKRRMGDLMAMIDPKNELTEEEKYELQKKLLSNSASVLEASENRLATYGAYSDENTERLTPHMQKFLRGLNTEDKNKFRNLHNELASQMGDPREWIQTQIELGNSSELIRLGIIDAKTGNIDLSKIQEAYLNFSGVSPGIRMGPRYNAGGFAFGKMARDLGGKKTVKETVKDTANSVKEAVMEKANEVADKVQDVFVEGDEYPRIRKALLLAGKYKTQFSNKVVKTIDDLKEPIVDEDGNVIVTQDELPKLVYYKTQQKLLTYVNKENLLRLGYEAKSKAANTAVNLKNILAASADSFLKELGSKSVDEQDGPADIYVGDDPTPRLTAAKMKAGQYVNAITEKVIEKASDITGPIRSLRGEMLIDEDELTSARVFNPKTMSLNPFHWAGRLAGWLGKKAWYLQTQWGPRRAAKNLKFLWKVTKALSKPVVWVTKKTAGAFLGGAAKGAGLQIKIFDLYSRKTGKISLVGKLLKAGKYFSEKTGNIIKSFKDIDGPVRDMDTNQVVLSQEDLDAGLTDANQQPVNVGANVKETLNGVAKTAKGYFKTLRTQGGFVLASGAKATKEAAEAARDKFKQSRLKNMTMDKLDSSMTGTFEQIRRKFGLDRQEAESLHTAQTLEDIRDELGSKKVRKNSFEDMMGRAQNLKDKVKDGIKNITSDPKSVDAKDFASVFGLDKLSSGFGSIKELVKGALEIEGLVKGGGALLNGGSKVLKYGGKAMKLLGLGRLAAGLGGILGMGGAAAAEGAAGVAAGGSVLATIGTGIVAAGGALLSFVTSPIVLGTAAVAAAGYGGYKAYKYFSKQHDSLLTKLRLVQYGFSPTDTERYPNAFSLESACQSAIKKNTDGTFGFDFDKVKLSDIMSPLGLDYRNSELATKFLVWFKGRFLPVYLTHLTALNFTKTTTDISDIDGLKPSEQLKMFDLVKMPEGPYGVDLPYAAFENVQSSSASDVAATTAYASTQLKKSAQDEKSNPSLFSKATSFLTGLLPTSLANKLNGNKDKNGYDKKNAKAAAVAAANAAGAPSLPDAEPGNITTGKGTSKIDPQATVSKVSAFETPNLKLAPGPLSDGRNAGSYLKLNTGVSLDKVNPQLRKQFYGLVEEYGLMTGKSVPVTDGFRTFEDQLRMKLRYPDRAASPGNSMHEFGLALDVDSSTLDDMERLGLLRKYGFTRPVGKEPWHLEPIGIQEDLSAYKNNPDKAEQAIASGVGKGGGGVGMLAQAPKNVRSADLSKRIMMAQIAPDETTITTPGVDKHPLSMSRPNRAIAAANQPTFNNSSTDGEARPTSSATAISVMDPDNSAYVPDASGSGYNVLKGTIEGAAKVVGIDPRLMLTTAAAESDFKVNASNSDSSAQGLGQFTDDTWNETIGKYGHLYGYDKSTSRKDTKASALMMAHYYKDNLALLSKKLNRPLTMTDAYMTHFLGPGGAIKFLTMMDKDPNSIPALSMPDAAKSNRAIFYNSNGTARTAKEIYDVLTAKLQRKEKEYGIGESTTNAVYNPNTSVAATPVNAVAPSTAFKTPIAQPPTVSASMGAAYGMSNKATMPSSMSEVSKAVDTSNDILRKQLDVEARMLNVLTNIDKKMETMVNTSRKAEQVVASNEPTTTPPATQTYTVPKGVVSMKRMGDKRLS